MNQLVCDDLLDIAEVRAVLRRAFIERSWPAVRLDGWSNDWQRRALTWATRNGVLESEFLSSEEAQYSCVNLTLTEFGRGWLD